MLESTYGDIHQGTKFKITLYRDTHGYTAKLDIAGLPTISDDDNSWATRDEALIAMVAEAHRIIEQ